VWREVGFNPKVHKEQVDSALPPDVAQDYQAVSDWVRRLFATHGDRLVVKVVDAASVEGFWLALRHRLRSFPAVVVGGDSRFSGTDFSAAEAEIARLLAAVPAA
jgi:hypothetical protein